MQELELQAKVVNDLQLNLSIPEIAAKHDISTIRVTRIKAKYEEAVKNNTVEKLLQLDQVLLNTATAQLKAELTSFDASIDTVAKQMKDSSVLLTNLDADLISTAHVANNKLRVFISSADTAGELSVLIDSLATLRNSFFNRPTTTVAIQNNMGAAVPPLDFSSDRPGEIYENR